VSQASLRITAHEDVRVQMARGYVDDSLLASLGGGVCAAVRGQRLMLTRIQLPRTIVVKNLKTTNGPGSIAAFCDLGWQNYCGARAGGYKWQCISIATFSSFI